MATTTISYELDPTETPYVHGSVHLTPDEVIAVQIYGYGFAAIVVGLMIYVCIYCTFFRPRKLRARKEAAANGDIENQEDKKKKKPFELSARWKAPPVDLTAPPPAKVNWWRRKQLPEPLTNGSFR